MWRRERGRTRAEVEQMALLLLATLHLMITTLWEGCVMILNYRWEMGPRVLKWLSSRLVESSIETSGNTKVLSFSADWHSIFHVTPILLLLPAEPFRTQPGCFSWSQRHLLLSYFCYIDSIEICFPFAQVYRDCSFLTYCVLFPDLDDLCTKSLSYKTKNYCPFRGQKKNKSIHHWFGGQNELTPLVCQELRKEV